MTILSQLESFAPLKNFCLSHTPFQIEHFRTASQKGNRKWEYWQHIVQIKALHRTLKDLTLDIEEAQEDLEASERFLFPWNRRKKNRRAKRLRLKLDTLADSFLEKGKEADWHLSALKEHYSDLFSMNEAELLASEEEYWIARLSRQMGLSILASKNAVNLGDLSAIASLPEETQVRVFAAVKEVIQTQTLIEQESRKSLNGNPENSAPRLREPSPS